MSKQVTIGTILARLKKQGLTEEQALNLPISVGVSDDYSNFDTVVIFEDYPNLYGDTLNKQFTGIRLNGHLTIKKLSEKRKGK